MKHLLLALILSTSFYSSSQADSTQLYNLLDTIVGMGHRVYSDTSVLNSVGDFIYSEFESRTENVNRQSYRVGGITYSNICALVGDTTKPRVVVGAHYDVFGKQDGADDNGSGVVRVMSTLLLQVFFRAYAQ